MRYGPPFHFSRRRDGRRLAYQVVGEGGLDLVFLLGWPTHLGLMWEDPSFAAFLGKLSSVVVFGSHPARCATTTTRGARPPRSASVCSP